MIFKRGERERFTIIDNVAVQDNTLSFKARGLLAYLLSLPEDWHIYETEISEHSTDGIKAVRSGIKELISAGYISRSSQRNPSGKFMGYEYLVYDKPHNQANLTIMPKTENGLRHTTKYTKTKRTNKRPKLEDKLTAIYDLERTISLNG